jgi:hypothetical protein
LLLPAVTDQLSTLAGADDGRCRRYGATDRRAQAGEGAHQAHDGAANPELDTLGRIADALGVQPRDLFEE